VLGEPEPQVLDVAHRLLDQLPDVLVVQRVVDAAAVALADDQAEMAKDAQLVGDRGAVHLDRGADLAHRCRSRVEVGEDAQAAGSRQCLHRLGNLPGYVAVEQVGRVGVSAVAHSIRIAEELFSYLHVDRCAQPRLQFLYRARVATGEWVQLSYRVPREPSTPRIAIWRQLRSLGVAKLGDGLVALPLDPRTREQFEWIADEIEQAGGEAAIWIARPGSGRQERTLIEAMREAISGEYRELIESAAAAESAPSKRDLAKLRRHLRKVKRRDYFPPPERERAEVAIGNVAEALRSVAA